MSRPYRTFEDDEIIHAEDWNQVQTLIKEEIRTHQHGGGVEGETDPAMLGGKLRTRSLEDGAVSTEKIAPDSVSSRVVARAAVRASHFRADAAIDEHKFAFDPDESVANATTRVELSVPADIAGGDAFLWPIPPGTPITDDVGELVFRTTEPVVVSDEQTSVEVSVRSDLTGSEHNIPAGTLTRVGGALDPFLRRHVAVMQQSPASGGVDAGDGQPPRAAQAAISFRIAAPAPPTYWLVPKGTRVSHQPAGEEAIVYATQQSLHVFPRSRWVEVEALATGAASNVAAGALTTIADVALATRVAVDQPDPATGGATGQRARCKIRLRLLGELPEAGLVIAAGTVVSDGAAIEFQTLTEIILDAGGEDFITAEPVDPQGQQMLPPGPVEVATDARPRLEKIFDPVLRRYLSAEVDGEFTPPVDTPELVRIVFSFSSRAPHSAWLLPTDSRATVSGQEPGAGEDEARPTPIFAIDDDLVIVPRSGWVVAQATEPGSGLLLPAGTLHAIEDFSGGPDLLAALEVDQPRNGDENAQALLRFRVVEGTMPGGVDEWDDSFGYHSLRWCRSSICDSRSPDHKPRRVGPSRCSRDDLRPCR